MDDNALLRYSRQIMLPDIEVAGQEALLAATVLIVGLGGLGSPVCLYLAAAGVGHLILADFDTVDLSNLQRQIAHRTSDVGELKVRSAANAITEINPGVRVTCIEERLDGAALLAAVTAADVVVDGTDNFSVRYKISDACVQTATPLVSGAATGLEGQLMVYDPRIPGAPCYRCLYDGADDRVLNCAEAGVAAPTVGVIGTLQASETIKLIVGYGKSLAGHLLVWDARYMEFHKLKLTKNPNCPGCGAGTSQPTT